MRQTTYDEVPVELNRLAYDLVSEICPREGPKDEPTVHWYRTPQRFARYLTHLGRMVEYDRWTTFPAEGTRPMVVVPNIPFWSACTHHLLPFMGTVSVGYVPHHKIIGLSKIPLLVRCIAKGFWMQEDLGHAIYKRFDELVEPLGVGVLIRAQHTCQLLDVGPPIPWMVTSELHGVLLHTPAAKQEFLGVCNDHKAS